MTLRPFIRIITGGAILPPVLFWLQIGYIDARISKT